jgi:hypothetical protein
MRTFAVLAGAALVAACLAVSVPALTPTKVVKIGGLLLQPQATDGSQGNQSRVALGRVSPAQRRRGPVRFHSPTQVRGTFSHVFTTKGTYTLYCTLHPLQMRETITVR